MSSESRIADRYAYLRGELAWMICSSNYHSGLGYALDSVVSEIESIEEEHPWVVELYKRDNSPSTDSFGVCTGVEIRRELEERGMFSDE